MFESLTLEAIYSEHFDFVHGKAARLGGPGIDPEDVAQEVFIVVAERLHTYDGSSLITTWLYGITLNVVRSMRRRLRVRRIFEREKSHFIDVPSVRSIDQMEVQDAYRIAYEILEKISAKKREVFIMHELDGVSCEEIAQVTGAKIETVWSRLHYARKAFTSRLAHRKERA
jgi:RNA polymerase sigma-70 factor (ECF subfamily)